MNLPKKDKQARVNDIKKMLLPEMVPEQLLLLGLSVTDVCEGSLEHARLSEAPGMATIMLSNSRARVIKSTKAALYAERSSSEKPSSIDLLIENTDRFIHQTASLESLFTAGESSNELIYRYFDRMIETAFHIGYSAGSNDALALTDRYTNSGYQSKVTQPQQGGKSKANAIDPVKNLVCDMANHIYQNQRLSNTPKPMLTEVIYNILRDFSQYADNKNIPSLLKFADRTPEQSTIKAWIKNIKKPNNLLKLPKPSLTVVKEALKSSYTMTTIKKALKGNAKQK
jgi:hypothetical protein